MANNVLQTTELLNKLNEILAKNSALLDKAAQSGEKFSKSLKLPSEYVNQLKNQETQAKKLGKAEKELDQTIKSKIPTLRQLASIKKSQDAADKREQRNLEKTTGLYNRVQIAVNKVTKRYNDLAIKKQLQGRLTAKEERDLTKLEAKLFKYNNALKTVDRQIGKNQRNVGNYSSALTGLGTTFRSLVGAFGFTSGVFLFAQGVRDAIQTVKDFDGGLKDVSKTSGLTGNDLEELGEGVIDLSEKLRVVGVKALLDYATVAGQLGVKGKENILEFAESLAVLETASDIQGEEGGRNIARLLTIVDGGVENVSDFADEIVILGNNFAATENEILSNATAIAQNTGVYKLGRQEILAYATATKAVGLEAEITGSSIGRTLATLEESIATGKNVTVTTKLLGRSQEELAKQFKENSTVVLNDFVKALNQVDKEGGSVNGVLTELGITAIRDKRVIASLATGGYDVLTRALNDVENASGSALREFETASSKIGLALNKVQNAFDRFVLSIEDGNNIIGKVFVSAMDMAAAGIDNVTMMVDSLSNGLEVTSQTSLKVRKNLLDMLPTTGIYSYLNNIREVTNETIKVNEQIEKYRQGVSDQNEAYVKLNGTLAPHLQDLAVLEEKYESLGELLGFYTDVSDAQSETVANLRLRISNLNKEIELSSKTDIEGIRVKQDKIKELQKELDAILGVNKATKESIKSRLKEKEVIEIQANAVNSLKLELEEQIKAYEKVKDLYVEGSEEADFYTRKINELKIALGELSAIDVSGAMAEIAAQSGGGDSVLDPPEDATARWEDTFQSITDVARRAFGIIQQLSDAAFEKQFEDLEKQKEAAFMFTEEGTAARLEQERQFEQKNKEIQIRQAKAKKAQGLFDITIDTAAAVVRALPNIPLSIVIGALGAAQLAMVAAQPIPQFWQGGEVGGSQQIMVNDDPYGRKGSNYKEVVEKPNGQLLTPQGKNVKMTVPKGSFVHPTYDAFINSLDSELLSNNIMPVGMPNIMPMVVNKGLSKSDVLEVMNNHASRLERTINNKKSIEIIDDERGRRIYEKSQNKKVQVMNARYKGVGKSV